MTIGLEGGPGGGGGQNSDRTGQWERSVEQCRVAASAPSKPNDSEGGEDRLEERR
jgi:hypothetical protein